MLPLGLGFSLLPAFEFRCWFASWRGVLGFGFGFGLMLTLGLGFGLLRVFGFGLACFWFWVRVLF